MLPTLRKTSPLLLWCVITIYTISVAFFANIGLVKSHYIGFTLLGIAVFAQFISQPGRHLMVLLLLIVGFFGHAALFPSVYMLTIGSLAISWPNLLLIAYFVVINRKDLTNWFAYIFSD